jgi:hypothetical protein
MVGVFNVGVINKIPNANQALNLYPLLLREMDAVKTDILTINKPH